MVRLHTLSQNVREHVLRSRIRQIVTRGTQHGGDLKRVESEESVDAADGEYYPPARDVLVRKMQVKDETAVGRDGPREFRRYWQSVPLGLGVMYDLTSYVDQRRQNKEHG